MYLLETLGGLVLANGTRAASLAQRRRLALLALLAGAGERGVSRDKIQLYLWPEKSGDQARHGLDQLVYEMRRQLGESVFAGTNPLSLNPAVIGSDLDQFEQAYGRGEWEAAAGVYRGPFLDGFHLSDAPEFERWADETRDDLARRYRNALQRLALGEAERGDPRRAVEWWRRLVLADPYATESTLGLMRALIATGDRVGAIERARVHEALIREELGAVPDPALAALAGEIRRGTDFPVERTTPGPVRSSLTASPAPSPSPVPMVTAPEAGRSPPRSRRRMAAAGLAAAIAGSLWVAHAARSAGAARPSRTDAGPILIVPFRASDPSLRQLGGGFADLLAARLWGDGGLAVIKPDAVPAKAAGDVGATLDQAAERRVAARAGAGQVLEGDAVRTSGSGLVLNATLRTVATGQVRLVATAAGSADSLPRLMDRLAAVLLARAAGVEERHLAQLSAEPLAAVKDYLAGRAALRSGVYDAAVGRFVRALAADSSFALAGLALADAAGARFRLRPVEPAISTNGWPVETDSEWIRGVEIARADSARLDRGDRAYLDLLAGRHFPDATPARDQLFAWERATEAQADRAEIFAHYGRLLLYQGAAAGIGDARERARAAFGRAHALDAGSADPIAGLIEVAAFERDSSALRRLELAYLAVDSTGAMADYVRWRVASLADPAVHAALRAGLDSLDSAALSRLVWTSQMDGVALEDAEPAAEILLRRASTLTERMTTCAESGHLSLNRGRPRTAVRTLDAGRTLDQQTYCEPLLYLYYRLYWDGDSARAAAVVDDLRRRSTARDIAPDRRPDVAEMLALAQWDLWHGDTTVAAKLLPAMGSSADAGWQQPRAALLAAMLAAVEGAPDAVRLALRADSTARLGCCVSPHWADPALVRVWERLGDSRRALEAARREEWYFAPEYLSGALQDEARLAARLGDRAGADRAYRHLLALQSDPEPEYAERNRLLGRELDELERQPH